MRNRETVAQKIRDSSGKTDVTQGEGLVGEMETASWKLKTLRNGHSFEVKRETVAQKIRYSSGDRRGTELQLGETQLVQGT